MPQTTDCLQKWDGSNYTDSMVWSDSTTVSVKNNGKFPTETFKNNSPDADDDARAGIEILQNRAQGSEVQAFLIVFPSNYTSGQTWAAEFASRFALVVHTNATGVDIVADKSTGDIRFYTAGHASTNERMRIKSDGYVGIGVSPSYPLHVRRASGTDVCALETASGGSASANLVFRPQQTQAGEIKATALLFEINANNTNQDLALKTQGVAAQGIFIKAGGNVGLGTTTPAEKLEVDGNIQLKSAGNGLKIKQGDNATMGIAEFADASDNVTVSTTKVTASSRIFLTCQDGDAGNVYVNQRTAGTSFQIKRSNPSGVRNVAWLIVEPA